MLPNNLGSFRFLAIALLLIAAGPRAARAAWPQHPSLNLPVSVAPLDQRNPSAISDGAGGFIVAWIDSSSGVSSDIHVQRVSATGDPLWGASGVVACAADGRQDGITLAPDGGGGVIVGWTDFRPGTTAGDLYAQRIDGAGVVQWTADGAVVSAATNPQQGAKAVTDGSGGAIFVFQDMRNFVPELYAQRVNGAGVPQWPGDVQLTGFSCGGNCNAFQLDLVSDGAGGAIAAWVDQRTSDFFELDIYAQRIDGNGTAQWTPGGVAVCTAPFLQVWPSMASDGAGGAIIAWTDVRTGLFTESAIFTQRVDATGNALWTPNGVELRTTLGLAGSQKVVSDAAGGAIVVWQDRRGGVDDVYARRISSGGSALWTANGVPVSTATGDQQGPQIAIDDAGGAIVTWEDHRSGAEGDIYVQRITSNGDASWAADGVAVCTSPGTQIDPVAVSDGAGGVLIAWADQRNGADLDIYAQRVERGGAFGRPQPFLASVRDIPNDQGGRVKVSWNASNLDAAPGSAITEYRVWRSSPPNFAARSGERGDPLARAGRAADSPGGTMLEGVPLPTNAAAYWEYLVTLPAAQLPSYSYVAPTTSDSVAFSNPFTMFMVEAIGNTGHWFSLADSGYSVDNLAPVGPAPFTARYVNGSVALHWGRNPEPDFANYRLYRGASGNFTPGPSNRVTQQPDTGYVDVRVPGEWYKLSAVDAHGNESLFALLGPQDILGVPLTSGSGPWLSAPRPNPMTEDALIAFGLPIEARVTLTVFDLGGRVVRRLLDRTLPAGPHATHWDGTGDDGKRMPGGVYLYRMQEREHTLQGRIALLR